MDGKGIDTETRWIFLAGCVLACLAVGGASGVATAGEVQGWYRTLARPSFAPPNWLFGPVWTLLYATMGVALWRVAGTGSPQRPLAIALFALQIGLNAAWPFLFFRAHALGAALVEILLLWIAIAATIWVFARISPLAAWLMAPYLGWVTFATALNAGFWRLN